jgi:ribosome-binding protein aMBF1 (putative translation factor)
MRRLQIERQRRGLSRSMLARLATMHPSTVGQIEAGRLVAYDSQLEKLARALGFDGEPAELMDECQDTGR